jgi:predicted amidophosphoribosyltransferase
MRRSAITLLCAAVVEDLAACLFPAACRTCGAALPPHPSTVPRSARPHSALFSGALRRRLAGPISLPLYVLCPRCALELRPSRATRPLAGEPGLACTSAFEPTPAAFEIVHALKYEGAIELAPWLGAHLAAAARRGLGSDLRGAALVPVPLHVSRLRERGFNQSLLLAREVGLRLGVPVFEAVLERRRPTRPQAQLPPEERHANVAEAFARCSPLPAGSGLLILVDDVATTGATLSAAARALGAPAVALALCHARDAGISRAPGRSPDPPGP